MGGGFDWGWGYFGGAIDYFGLLELVIDLPVVPMTPQAGSFSFQKGIGLLGNCVRDDDLNFFRLFDIFNVITCINNGWTTANGRTGWSPGSLRGAYHNRTYVEQTIAAWRNILIAVRAALGWGRRWGQSFS